MAHSFTHDQAFNHGFVTNNNVFACIANPMGVKRLPYKHNKITT